MPDAFIVSGARTPIGRSHKGSLVDVDAFDLARISLSRAMGQAEMDLPSLLIGGRP